MNVPTDAPGSVRTKMGSSGDREVVNAPNRPSKMADRLRPHYNLIMGEVTRARDQELGDRRNQERVGCTIPISLRCGPATYPGFCTDVSRLGLGLDLECDEPLERNAAAVVIDLGEGSDVVVTGEIVWSTPRRCGFMLHEPLSLRALYRLLRHRWPVPPT